MALVEYEETIEVGPGAFIFSGTDTAEPALDRWPRVIRRWAQKHAGERR